MRLLTVLLNIAVKIALIVSVFPARLKNSVKNRKQNFNVDSVTDSDSVTDVGRRAGAGVSAEC